MKALKQLLLIFLLPILLIGCGSSDTTTVSEDSLSKLPLSTKNASESSDLKVHFLDVGQGLAILVQSAGKTLIYDGGDRDTSSFVVSYLKDQGVEQIDYLISSHYDSDHLSGLIGCLNAFTVHNVISSDYEHDTKLYKSFVSTVAEKGLIMQHPQVGSTFALGNAEFTILAPTAIVSDSNANSVVIKLKNGDNSFIFTGDADHNSEADMCSLGLDLSCDVLSVSHHGSATATSYDFLEAILPQTAVISVGAGNQYGHPHIDVLEKLEAMEIDVYRSDQQGTVIATSNGTQITWNSAPSSDYTSDDGVEADAATDPSVWKSKAGSKYHSRNDCGTMNPDNASQIPQSQAISEGLDRCKNCW